MVISSPFKFPLNFHSGFPTSMHVSSSFLVTNLLQTLYNTDLSISTSTSVHSVQKTQCKPPRFRALVRLSGSDYLTVITDTPSRKGKAATFTLGSALQRLYKQTVLMKRKEDSENAHLTTALKFRIASGFAVPNALSSTHGRPLYRPPKNNNIVKVSTEEEKNYHGVKRKRENKKLTSIECCRQ
jgi:hypothetical protein